MADTLYECISIEVLGAPGGAVRPGSSAMGEVEAPSVRDAAEFFIQDHLMEGIIEPGRTFIGVKDGGVLWLCGILDGHSAWVTCTEPVRCDVPAPDDLREARPILFELALRSR